MKYFLVRIPLLFAVSLHCLMACGDDSGQGNQTDCMDSQCDDGLFCNGIERCNAAGQCVPGTAPNIDDGVSCTMDSCDEVNDTVVHNLDHDSCNDGLFCNGIETCHLTNDCQGGVPPTEDDGVQCTDAQCIEETDSFVHVANNARCDNGLFCDGEELCDAVNGCQPGSPVIAADDGDSCTVDICHEDVDAINVPRVLVYDSTGDAQIAAAITARGYSAAIHTVDADFNTAFDAGQFSIVLASSAALPTSIKSRITNWVNSGGRALVYDGQLPADNAFQTALGVSTSAPTPTSLTSSPQFWIDLFNHIQSISPLPLADLASAGSTFATTFTNRGYPLATMGNANLIMSTHGGRTITHGFGWLDAAADDSDSDLIPDGQELLENELDIVCTLPQPQLYACQYYGNDLDILDPDDLSVISTLQLSSNFAPVTGCFGLAQHPTTGDDYVLYQTSGESNRRLGRLDRRTGAITDIGNAGNMTDIAFDASGILFGVTGAFSADFSLYIIDTVTANGIFILDTVAQSYGTGLAYTPRTDEIFVFNNSGVSTIDPATFIETVTSIPPDETQALAWDPARNRFIQLYYGTAYLIDPTTESRATLTTYAKSYHGLAFL